MEREGLDLEVVPVPADRLPTGTGRTVNGRTAAVLSMDPDFDCVIVHRDAEADGPDVRYDEVRSGADQAGFDGSVLAVVPVRMTEAWLLLDETEIRRVAGPPKGGPPLSLPSPKEAERLADPKARLDQVLVEASGDTGRKLRMLRNRFGENRRRLLESLDIDGPVRQLSAFARLVTDIQALATTLDARRT